MGGSKGNNDVLPWLELMLVLPKYQSSIVEFQDPIDYIFKIEKEGSKYGICKIIPQENPYRQFQSVTRKYQLHIHHVPTTSLSSRPSLLRKHTSNAILRRAWVMHFSNLFS
ncbi:hypothetical protein AAZX31_03G045400 [Glycine max]